MVHNIGIRIGIAIGIGIDAYDAFSIPIPTTLKWDMPINFSVLKV